MYSQDVERPAESVELETVRWQRLYPSSDVSLVFSAHYDDRWRPVSMVKIIGITATQLNVLYCRLWYRDSRLPVYTPATVQDIGESHGRR